MLASTLRFVLKCLGRYSCCLSNALTSYANYAYFTFMTSTTLSNNLPYGYLMPLTFLNVLSSNDIYLQQHPFCLSNILLYRIHLSTSFIIVMLTMACMNSTTSTIGVLSKEQNVLIRFCFVSYDVGKGSRSPKNGFEL